MSLTAAPRVPVRVRTAADDDLPALRLVAARSFDRERLHRAGVVDLLFARQGADPALRLVADRGGEVVGFLVASVPPGAPDATGFVDGAAVAPHARRQGVATALLAEVEARLAAAGCREVLAGGSAWSYAWPGVDLGYTAALVAAERAGFVQQAVARNMDVDLADWVPGHGPASLPARGEDRAPARTPPGAPAQTLVRRAVAADVPALRDLVAAHFTAVWEHELRMAVDRERPTAFVAERAGRVVGFAAHGVHRVDAFGPLGTAPAERGSGVGGALLRACLDDMAAAGLSTAQISWIGPAGFYSRTVGARVGRTFAVLRKTLAGAGPTVHVVGANPAQDRLQVVPHLVPGEVHRATEVVSRPGGKGMIVARGVVRLGGRAALHGFVGGAVGAQVSAGCRELGITDFSTRVEGETRTTTVLVDAASGASTVVNEPGPVVTAPQVDALVEGLLRAVRPGDLVVCTGSLPPGAPVDLYARIVRALRERGVPTLVDTSGAPLAEVVRAGPDVLKVNEHELRSGAGLAGPEEDAVDLEVLVGRALQAGVSTVVVTRGADGLVHRSRTSRTEVVPPAVDLVNATGSGDLALAGFVTALATGQDLETALRRAAAAGAAGAARLDPDLPDPAEVDRLQALATATTTAVAGP